MQSNITKTDFRLRIDLSVASHRAEIGGISRAGAIDVERLAFRCLFFIIDGDGTDAFAAHGQKVRVHIGVSCVVHVSVLIEIGIRDGIRTEMAQFRRHTEAGGRDVERRKAGEPEVKFADRDERESRLQFPSFLPSLLRRA